MPGKAVRSLDKGVTWTAPASAENPGSDIQRLWIAEEGLYEENGSGYV